MGHQASKHAANEPAVQCSQEDFLLHYTPQSEEGRKEGEKDGVRIMWWEEGGRKRGSELAAGKPK